MNRIIELADICDGYTYGSSSWYGSRAALAAEVARVGAVERELLEALGSIAKNTCCDRCQEAALVARAAIAKATGVQS